MRMRHVESVMMKGKTLLSIVIATGCCLCLFKSGGLAASSQQPSSVVISWQVRLDDTTNFDFTRLSVSLQRRPGKPHAWTMVGSFTPDKDGRFVASVPAGSWLSVDVTTSDPTVQRSTDSPDDVDFYELEKNKTETIMRQEFYVPADSPERIERALELQRGAAFSVCVPDGLKSGSIQFYKESQAHEDKVSVVSFIDVKTVYGSVIGGLENGKWRVMYIGDNDIIFRSEELDLRRGEVLHPKCGNEAARRDTLLPALFVLHDDGGNYFNDLFLLAAGQTGNNFKNLLHPARRSGLATDLH